jgi:hypothetical protein
MSSPCGAIAKLSLSENVHPYAALQHDLAALPEVSPDLLVGCALFTNQDTPTDYNRILSAMGQLLESMLGWVTQETDITEHHTDLLQPKIESALLWQTGRCRFIAHFLLLILII